MPVRKREPREQAIVEEKPFSESELKELHDMLLAERDRLERRLDFSADAQAHQPGRSEDLENIGSDNFNNETKYRLMSDDRRRLEMIDEALSNLAHGKYGICQACGKQIRLKRLQAKPYAKYCITCKAKREKSGLSAQEF